MSPRTTADRVVPTRPTSIGYGHQCLDAEDVEAIRKVLASDFLTQGPEVPRFERELRAATGAPHAVAVANGTCALHLAYAALGIGPGRRVLTSANTFLATATAALHAGAEVDFLDVHPGTANLDVELLEERLAEGERPDAVVAVHFAGLPCDMERLIALKRRFGFLLVEDAAHALGARYRVEGETYRVGEHPEVDATCLSFHPVKLITTAEGGAVLTHDAALAERLRLLGSHGIDRAGGRTPFEGAAGPEGGEDWFAPMVALRFNFRLSDVHAALGRSQLKKLPRFLERRRSIAERYRGVLTELAGFELLSPGGPEAEHAWHLFVVRVPADERPALYVHLREHGIVPQLHYYPVPLQPWFRERYGEGSYPRAEHHARTALSLPIHPGLETDDERRVLAALEAWRA